MAPTVIEFMDSAGDKIFRLRISEWIVLTVRFTNYSSERLFISVGVLPKLIVELMLPALTQNKTLYLYASQSNTRAVELN